MTSRATEHLKSMGLLAVSALLFVVAIISFIEASGTEVVGVNIGAGGGVLILIISIIAFGFSRMDIGD
jgi:hypothetical protein